jgi:D5 N terminal like
MVEDLPAKIRPRGPRKDLGSFGRGYEGPHVTIATIYHLAKEHGWVDRSGRLAAVRKEAALPAPKSGIDFAGYARTDAGNALAFLDLFGESLRFVEKWRGWIVWDGARWCEVSDTALLPLARRATEEMIKWAAAQPSGDNRKGWINHAFASQRDARLRAMINLAKGESRIRIEPDALDWTLGFWAARMGRSTCAPANRAGLDRRTTSPSRSAWSSIPKPTARNGAASSIGRRGATVTWSHSSKCWPVTP